MNWAAVSTRRVKPSSNYIVGIRKALFLNAKALILMSREGRGNKLGDSTFHNFVLVRALFADKRPRISKIGSNDRYHKKTCCNQVEDCKWRDETTK